MGFPTRVEEGAPIAFFTTGGTRLALYPLDWLAEYVGVTPQPGCGNFCGIALSHHVRTQGEVSAVLALAEQAGGRIVKPAQRVFWGGYSGCFADPDGYRWEVAWAPMFGFNSVGELMFSRDDA